MGPTWTATRSYYGSCIWDSRGSHMVCPGNAFMAGRNILYTHQQQQFRPQLGYPCGVCMIPSRTSHTWPIWACLYGAHMRNYMLTEESQPSTLWEVSLIDLLITYRDTIVVTRVSILCAFLCAGLCRDKKNCRVKCYVPANTTNESTSLQL